MNEKIFLKAHFVKNKKNGTRVVMKIIVKGTCENIKYTEFCRQQLPSVPEKEVMAELGNPLNIQTGK